MTADALAARVIDGHMCAASTTRHVSVHHLIKNDVWETSAMIQRPRSLRRRRAYFFTLTHHLHMYGPHLKGPTAAGVN